jgi:hypothetical protein
MMSNEFLELASSVPEGVIHCEAEVTFEARHHGSEEEDKMHPPKFKMVANTGRLMNLGGFGRMVVIDFMGLKIPNHPVPIRANHDSGQGVGHTTKVEVVEGRQLIAEGVISRDTEAAREIVSSASKGFPWQASVGVSISKMDHVESDVTMEVNGRKMKGPMTIVRGGELSEISFVDLGADRRTSATVSASQSEGEGEDMETKKTKEDEVRAQEGKEAPPKKVEAAQEPEVKAKKVDTVPEPLQKERDAAITATREQVTAELKRVNAVQKLCAGKDLLSIAEKAINEGWDEERTELEVLRATRPKSTTAIHTRGEDSVSGQVLEAACLVTAKADKVEEQYGEKILDAVHRRFRQGIGLQEMILECAWANGYTGRSFKNDPNEILRYAFGRDLRAAAGFSTIDIGGILSNVANKFLLEGFFMVEAAWRQITAVRNVSDFKTITSYRLVGTEQYEKVPPGGEIKHGTLGEQTFTNKAETYGLMLTIDRRDIINDDLGAITTVPRKLGRGSGLKINDVFWTAFMANSSFFTAGNKNYQEGAADLSLLTVGGLTAGERLFLDQTDPDGKPLGTMPKFLLVPTGLSVTAAQIFNSLELRDTTASTKFLTMNPHAGKYTPVVSRYLGNASYSGNSQVAWYLIGDPNDIPVIETAFLNGQEAPTIENSEADFNVLGVSMRGFHDFGVALQDTRGGIKSKGAA